MFFCAYPTNTSPGSAFATSYAVRPPARRHSPPTFLGSALPTFLVFEGRSAAATAFHIDLRFMNKAQFKFSIAELLTSNSFG